MDLEDNLTGLQLEDAFQLFNQLSETLAESYGDLQIQVEHLSKELAEARNERLKQLAEKELIANRLERLLDTLPAGIVVLDGDGCISQANPVAHDMLGEDLTGQSWQTIAQQVFISDRDELRLQDGRWVSVSVRSLDAEPGKIILVTDITETHTLQGIVSRQQRLTSLGEMLASLAHQIRTPLATALLYLSNLAHPHAQSGDRVHYAEKARERLHHLERMVNDMLIFARGEASDSEYFDVADFVEEFRQSLEPQFSESKAILTIQNQTGNASLCGNRDALFGAFHNLVNNAIQSCDDSLMLEIKVSMSDEDMVEFCFKDNGCGISDEIKDRVLEPFFTTRTNGTGLGLAVVNATVSSYNGKFDIQSQAGVGSCLSIKLPLMPGSVMLPSEINNTDTQALLLIKHPVYKNNKSNNIYDEKEVSV
jgi:two-component system sensor histidine kinase FlrB